MIQGTRVVQCLLGRRTRRATWAYLFWFIPYLLTAWLFAGDMAFHAGAHPYLIPLLIPVFVVVAQIVYPTLLGWAVIFIPSVLYCGAWVYYLVRNATQRQPQWEPMVSCFVGAYLALLDERSRRLMAASEAVSLGYGGISQIRRASGLSRKAIANGIREIAEGTALPGRIRRSGAGRKSITESDPKLLASLERLIEPETRGDPESPLRWVCKSTRNLAAQLTGQKHPVCHVKVAQLLHDQGYSLQSNRKTEEGADHPDRDAQFRHINAQVKRALKAEMPVISVDTKKKELLGNYKNDGRQWLPAKKPVKVNGHDFPSPDVPRAYPYGIYDLGRNTGFVNIGTDHDTGAFAVASIRGWWRSEGKSLY